MAALVKDIPVEFQANCAVAGDLLDTRKAEEKGLVAEYNGKKYYFCCPPCKPTFLANPEYYASDKKEQIALTFLRKEHITDNIWSFSFAPSKPLEWTAGQYIRVEVPHDTPDKQGTKRWFTVSSAPYEAIITITTRVTGSSFKQALAHLEAGATIDLVDMPSGDFTWDKTDDAPRVFIVGGIGITPFYSIAKQRMHDGLPLNATLLYANRTEHIAFRGYFDGLENAGLTVRYVEGKKLTTESIAAARATPTASFYISGAEPMVKQFANELISYGVAEDQITQDAFPHYSEQTY